LNDSERFGQRLRKIRESAGFKQVQLARLLDVDSKHLSRLERGKVNPSFEIIFRIARTLKVSPSLLFEFDDSEVDSKILMKQIQQFLAPLSREQLGLARRLLKTLFTV
jgi:transcriptional regulator with XRE-family HTH domain